LIKRKKLEIISLLFILSILSIPLRYFGNNLKLPESERQDKVNLSAQVSETKQWIKNPTFESPIEPTWFWKNGTEGDNSDIIAVPSSEQANFTILGDSQTIEISDPLNDGSWQRYKNDVFLFPDTSVINKSGLYVDHDYDETVNQTRNYHSVHIRKNVNLGINMSDYVITAASLKVNFNATVNVNVDTSNVNFPVQFGIGDFATFYVLISDINRVNPYRVANNKTTNLGQDSGPILNINNKDIETVAEEDLITALTSSLEKDIDYSNFTITLGIDIYCEDNGPPSNDHDTWEALIIRSCNLTFSYEKKIDQFTTISWNQVGNALTGGIFQILEAKLNFKYLINETWPSSAPLSEIRFVINNKVGDETVKLRFGNISFQEAKVGGFDVTSLIPAGINITFSIELFIKDNFQLNHSISISIDDVFLNISYIKTFPDYQTELELFLYNINSTDDPFVNIANDNLLNVTVKYRQNSNQIHITNASIQLEGKISGALTENIPLQQYSKIINVSQLGIGTRLLTIVAQKTNHESITFPFLIKVIERETEIQLFLNGVQKYDNSSTQIEINEKVNISVLYKDLELQNFLRGASVNLLGLGKLNETTNHYNITINTDVLEKGTNFLTIYAQLDNYQALTFQFVIDVIDISTNLQLLLNNELKTLDPIIDLPIGSMLNITIKYLEYKTGLPIDNPVVQLIGEGISTNLIENLSLKHHSVSLNTSDLHLGIKRFSIVANAIDYQIETIDLRITISRINSIISTESGESITNAHSGDNVKLKIVLNNTVYGDYIKGASVTYIWEQGQGVLTDPENDGIYEVILKNVPTGSHIITITAFAGDDYDFNTYEFTISVVRKTEPNLTWLIIGLTGGILILGVTITLYQTHFKYSPVVRKIRKLKKAIKKGKKVKTLLVNDRESILLENFQKTKEMLEFEPIQSGKKKVMDKFAISKQNTKKFNGEDSP